MRWLALFLLLLLPLSAPACPLCREAVTQTSAAEEIDRDREAASYNNSIYLMLGVPFLSVGVVGFCVYRGLRRGTDPRTP
jgi:hypothetical protein